jgi:hypothetical protein
MHSRESKTTTRLCLLLDFFLGMSMGTKLGFENRGQHMKFLPDSLKSVTSKSCEFTREVSVKARQPLKWYFFSQMKVLGLK